MVNFRVFNIRMKSHSKMEHGIDLADLTVQEAASTRNVNKLKQFLDAGCSSNQIFSNGQRSATLLHHVIGLNGCISSESLINAEECVKILLKHNADPNLPDSKKVTPLQLAVSNNMENVCHLLLESGASTSIRWVEDCGSGGLIATEIAKRMPSIFSNLLDKAVTTTNGKEEIQIDWKPVLQYHESKVEKNGNTTVELLARTSEMSFLYSLLDSSDLVQEIILTHPVISLFLHLKSQKYWIKFGIPFMLFQAVYWILYEIFLIQLYFIECKYEKLKDNSTIGSENSGQRCSPSGIVFVLACILTGFLTIFVLFEIRKLTVLRLDYFFDWTTIVYVFFTVNVAVTVWPALTFNDSYNMSWQYPMAMLGIFLILTAFLVQAAGFPIISNYLEMLFKILSTVLIGCIFFSPLLVGFYVSMKGMFDSDLTWFNFLTLVVSDADFENLIDSTRGNDKFYKTVAYIFVAAFIVVLIIAFLNLILGLAVEHILNIKKTAEVRYKKRQIHQLYLADKFMLFSRNTMSIVEVTDLPDDTNEIDKLEIDESSWKYRWSWTKIKRPNPIFRWILKSTDWDTLIVDPEKIKVQLVQILRNNN